MDLTPSEQPFIVPLLFFFYSSIRTARKNTDLNTFLGLTEFVIARGIVLSRRVVQQWGVSDFCFHIDRT
jgi:hypothetical protein